VKLLSRISKTGVILAALIFSSAVLFIDRSAGPYIRMPILFAIPVMTVSWYIGIVAGEILSVGLPLLRLLIEINVHKPWRINDSIINMAILSCTLSLIAFLVYNVNRQRRRIKILQGFLPICSFCKKIRTNKNIWEQMEDYISQHSEAVLSHSVCPECRNKHYGTANGKKNGDEPIEKGKAAGR
jgi:hypothetical protein